MGMIHASAMIHAHEPALDHVWCAAGLFAFGNYVLRFFRVHTPVLNARPALDFCESC